MLDTSLHVLIIIHPFLLLKIVKNKQTNKLRLHICNVMKDTGGNAVLKIQLKLNH